MEVDIELKNICSFHQVTFFNFTSFLHYPLGHISNFKYTAVSQREKPRKTPSTIQKLRKHSSQDGKQPTKQSAGHQKYWSRGKHP